MDEKVLDMFKAFGVEVKEGDNDVMELLKQMSEKYIGMSTAEPLEPAQEFLGIPIAEITENLGKDISGEKLLSLAKEGQEYHKKVSDEALAMGVRAMGNDFPKETWERTFSTMSTKDILNITKTWETQAKADIPAGRLTDPEAGQEKTLSLPDDAFKVGK